MIKCDIKRENCCLENFCHKTLKFIFKNYENTATDAVFKDPRKLCTKFGRVLLMASLISFSQL